MKSDQKIADAIKFAWERPAKKPVGVLPALAILLLMVAHASFPFLAVGAMGR